MLEKAKEASRAFMTKSLRQRVEDYLEKHPEANIYELYFEFPKVNPNTLKTYKSRYWHKVRNRLENLINFELLDAILGILRYKSVAAGKLTQKEMDAIGYLDKLVAENYKPTTKKR